MLNVSLRDYMAEVLQAIDVHVVDSWEEVCRENSDIECAHSTFGLQEEDTVRMSDLDGTFEDLTDSTTVMFNPIGMAIFDIAIARHFLDLAERGNIGIVLEGN